MTHHAQFVDCITLVTFGFELRVMYFVCPQVLLHFIKHGIVSSMSNFRAGGPLLVSCPQFQNVLRIKWKCITQLHVHTVSSRMSQRFMGQMTSLGRPWMWHSVDDYADFLSQHGDLA